VTRLCGGTAAETLARPPALWLAVLLPRRRRFGVASVGLSFEPCLDELSMWLISTCSPSATSRSSASFRDRRVSPRATVPQRCNTATCPFRPPGFFRMTSRRFFPLQLAASLGLTFTRSFGMPCSKRARTSMALRLDDFAIAFSHLFADRSIAKDNGDDKPNCECNIAFLRMDISAKLPS